MAERILVATDFSPTSERALHVACDYVRRLGAELHIVHVVWPGADPGPDARLDRLTVAGDVPVTTATLSGSPATQIVDYARRHEITLIVVGTHGRTGFSRALVGSVAERVVRTAPCPVLTVPAAVPAAVPTEAGAVTAPAHHCIVCGHVSEELICEACRARIRGEALEHKQGEERAGRG